MKPIFLAGAATLMLAACTTTDTDSDADVVSAAEASAAVEAAVDAPVPDNILLAEWTGP